MPLIFAPTVSYTRIIVARRGSTSSEDQPVMNRRAWLRSVGAGFVTSLPGLGRPALAQEAPYRSPYSLKFRHEVADLEFGFNQPPWNDPQLESQLSARESYSLPDAHRLGRGARTHGNIRPPRGWPNARRPGCRIASSLSRQRTSPLYARWSRSYSPPICFTSETTGDASPT